MARTFRPNDSLRTAALASFRLRLLDLPVMRWLLQGRLKSTLPPAVILNRLAAAFFVFFFGMEVPQKKMELKS